MKIARQFLRHKACLLFIRCSGGESRGGHAHKELQQFIVAASGSFDVTIDDGQLKRTLQLTDHIEAFNCTRYMERTRQFSSDLFACISFNSILRR